MPVSGRGTEGSAKAGGFTVGSLLSEFRVVSCYLTSNLSVGLCSRALMCLGSRYGEEQSLLFYFLFSFKYLPKLRDSDIDVGGLQVVGNCNTSSTFSSLGLDAVIATAVLTSNLLMLPDRGSGPHTQARTLPARSCFYGLFSFRLPGARPEPFELFDFHSRGSDAFLLQERR